MKHLSLLALIALSLSSSACEAVLLGASLADDDTSDEYSGEGEGYWGDEGNTAIESASFSGSIGTVGDISAQPDAVAYDDGEYASITLTTLESGWGAMVAFNMTGADRDSLFTPGGVILLSSQSATFAFGCSGDESDPYSYETGAQTAGTLTTREAGDGMLEVDFEVSFTGTDFASGSFKIAAP